ncbi:glutathione S-transferase N-terminal domain-containing protein [Sphaerospermopsis sp. LEGE 00249]|uniref:glutathione S-transferase N-terminal domain-containing protein n=1 Tax=Sphaerospermopsis sp. LEGE 00249 TaxID=1380707 RepID=UPI0021080D31|nr:glutathione S-transferase N-terminal domain-containing protein [Sphaerospermopsis sp. LEGE 00249]
MADIKIYSAVVCPYAHRTRLVLQEKGIDFDLIEIDLQNKPEGFTKVSVKPLKEILPHIFPIL